VKSQLLTSEQASQSIGKLAAEDLTEYLLWQKETGAAGPVRQRSMARMTLCCGQETRARLRSRKRPA